jgi:Ran GTPase-activating protein (RanGAP) involved in mRNA processing and transport
MDVYQSRRRVLESRLDEVWDWGFRTAIQMRLLELQAEEGEDKDEEEDEEEDEPEQSQEVAQVGQLEEEQENKQQKQGNDSVADA